MEIGPELKRLTGATLELNIADFARANGTKIGTLLFEKSDEAIAAMESGRCDGYTDDTGSLAAVRSTLRNPADWVVLEGVISKEPLGIHIRSGDVNWHNVTFWVDAALKTATGQVWRVTLEDVPGQPTLHEQQVAAEEAIKTAAWESDMVRAAREAFPEAELMEWPGKRSVNGA